MAVRIVALVVVIQVVHALSVHSGSVDDAARKDYERFAEDLGKRLIKGGLTMQVEQYLRGLKSQIEQIVDQGVEGDVYETGTWRGGTSIFMMSIMNAYEKLTGKQKSKPRTFWCFDSFEGFPTHKIDNDDGLKEYLTKSKYAAPLDSVRKSFKDYGLMDGHHDVQFVKGYFEDTVPGRKIPNPIAILRLDGDLYSSTKVVLENLYSHVVSGGLVIIDDYWWRPKDAKAGTKLCKEATDEFLLAHKLTDRLMREKDSKGKNLIPYWIKP